MVLSSESAPGWGMCRLLHKLYFNFSNGTFVNGRSLEVDQGIKLQPNDKILFGSSKRHMAAPIMGDSIILLFEISGD